HAFASAQNELPFGGSYDSSNGLPGSTGAMAYNWRSSILAYMEQPSIKAQIDTLSPLSFPDRATSAWCKMLVNLPAQQTVIPGYQCPSDPASSQVHNLRVAEWALTGSTYIGVKNYLASTSNYFGSGGPASIGKTAPYHCGLCSSPTICPCYM